MAAAEDEEVPFYVEALFPFVGTDASSLSFQRGDIIQVLNRLPSGWWDGLLDDERGWFPSNYVRRMLESEAIDALNALDLRRQQEDARHQQQQQYLAQQHRQNSLSQPQRGHPPNQYAQHDANGYWSDHATPAQDYWTPEVADNGQIYYVNSLTGQKSRDLPTDDGIPDSQLRENGHSHPHAAHNGPGAAVPHINTNLSHPHGPTAADLGYTTGRPRRGTNTSQASSSRVDPTSATGSHRSNQDYVGSVTSGAFGAAGSGGPNAPAGFGVFHRSLTPEPWERRLTDDGQAYFYFNTITSDAQWTRPEPHEGYPAQSQGGRTSQQQGQYGNAGYGDQAGFQNRSAVSNARSRNRTDSEASLSGVERDNRRLSVYSDDSEVSPLGKEERMARQAANDHGQSVANVRPWPTPGGKPADSNIGIQDDGTANPLRVAIQLQEKMAPLPLPPITIYSEKACEAIGAVVEAYGDTDHSKNEAGGGANGAANEENTERTSIETTRLQTMADRVALVVVAVRNLLYVSGTLAGSLPNPGGSAMSNGHGMHHHKGASSGGFSGVGLNGLGAGLADDADWVRQEIKPYQRKVTATLSKLVLSARAVNANPDWPSTGGRSGSSGRVESDAAELERAVTTFVYQIQRTAASSRAKRLQGVMLAGDGEAGIGTGLIGAGIGAGWKGAGFVIAGEDVLGVVSGPVTRIGREVVSELATLRLATEDKLNSLRTAGEAYKAALAILAGENTGTYDARMADLVILNGRLVVAHITNFMLHVEDVDIAMGVDVMGTEDDDEAYLAGVKRARELIRTFETAKQALYDDGAVLLLASQAIHVSSLGTCTLTNPHPTSKTGGPADVLLQSAIPAIQSNLGTLMETLELLLDIAHEQALIQNGREPMMSRANPLYTQYDHNGVPLPINNYVDGKYVIPDILGDMGDHPQNIDDLDFGAILDKNLRPGTGRAPGHAYGGPSADLRRSMDSDTAQSMITLKPSEPGSSTLSVPPSITEVETDPGDGNTPDDDEDPTEKPKPKPGGSAKISKFFGGDVPETYKQTTMPPYLRLDHAGPTELVTNPDGAVRAGTLAALIERLTMHTGTDARFTETFIMTFKSFATIDKVFEMLVERYNIQPPEGLTSEQLGEWTRVKKTPVRLRSINIMRKLIDALEKEDLHILERVKSFCNDVVASDPGIAAVAKTVLGIINRVETKGIESKRTMHATTSDFPPPSILPKKQGKFKLLDIDPLELARQLTILESELFFKIKQSECIARSKESMPAGPDNIKNVITVANKLADWVADAVLSKEDS